MASFYVVLAGKCRLKFHESEAGIPLGAGDLAVVLCGENHWLQSCRNESGIHAGDAPQKAKILRGRFGWDQKKLLPLLPYLSPAVCFRSEDGCIVSWMKKGIRMMTEGTDASGPGARAAIDHIAHTIFARSVQVLGI
jgi:hypothetical protein